jgi:hypothetical protein
MVLGHSQQFHVESINFGLADAGFFKSETLKEV